MATVDGTGASDTIVGKDGESDHIEGGAGNDTIYAYEGADGRFGVVGSGGITPTSDPSAGTSGDVDFIRGGDGNDILYSGAGYVTYLYSGSLSDNDYDRFVN
ncbi:MAG: hypothetical protein KDJ29_21060, partial [Hyphomicrobiales bacterium]|nr:hypothetical protein [Hyphomicrobiales bacterium]